MTSGPWVQFSEVIIAGRIAFWHELGAGGPLWRDATSGEPASTNDVHRFVAEKPGVIVDVFARSPDTAKRRRQLALAADERRKSDEATIAQLRADVDAINAEAEEIRRTIAEKEREHERKRQEHEQFMLGMRKPRARGAAS